MNLSPETTTLVLFIITSAAIAYFFTRCFMSAIKRYEPFTDCAWPPIVGIILIFVVGWLCQRKLDNLPGHDAALAADMFQTVAAISVSVIAVTRTAWLIFIGKMYSRPKKDPVVYVPVSRWNQSRQRTSEQQKDAA